MHVDYTIYKRYSEFFELKKEVLNNFFIFYIDLLWNKIKILNTI